MDEENPRGHNTRNRIDTVEGTVVQVGTVHGSVGFSDKRVWLAVAGVGVLVIGAMVVLRPTATTVVVQDGTTPPAVAEVAIRGAEYGGNIDPCNSGFYVEEERVAQALATTDLEQLRDEADGYMRTDLLITAQTVGDEAVLLTGMRLVDFQVLPPPTTGALLAPKCGGTEIPPRNFAVDLDRPNPVVVPIEITRQSGQAPEPATPFPFKISGSDPEVFLLNVERTQPCDCRYVVEIDWVARGEANTSRIDRDGAAFRLIKGASAPRYTTGGVAGETWVRE
ncbi:hypothetical protein AB0G02_16640 [Actinosynnema sp. NPDC023658]|uniref:hypothetical protein n=1 Tax=Actinosynnema sp. NPDC023658 TaxID=3155465 RepID=UPI0033C57DB7